MSGSLTTTPLGSRMKPIGKRERELAALGLGEQSGGQSAADRVQFKLGYRPLQPEKQAAVGAARIIDAITIGDEAAAQAADIQQRVPVGAVAREARHVDRQDQTHLAEPDPANEFLKAAALRGRCPAQAEIRIDHVDIGLMPSEFAGALAKRVLQPQALLIAHDLMGCRLSDIDHRLARQMGWLDQFGLHDDISARTAAMSSTIWRRRAGGSVAQRSFGFMLIVTFETFYRYI